MTAHVWNDGRCERCGCLSSWPLAKQSCGPTEDRSERMREMSLHRWRVCPSHRRGGTVLRVDELRAMELHREGLSYVEIAERLGTYRQRVRRLVLRAQKVLA